MTYTQKVALKLLAQAGQDCLAHGGKVSQHLQAGYYVWANTGALCQVQGRRSVGARKWLVRVVRLHCEALGYVVQAR